MSEPAGRRRENRRERILRAALDVFSERGYHRSSLAEIAARVGLTQPGLLHYFPSKDRLLTETLAEWDRGNIESARRSLRALGGTQTYLDWLVGLVARHTREPGMVRIFTVLSAESVTAGHPAREFFRNRYRQVRGASAEWIEAELGDSLPEGVSPEAAAAILVAVLDGIQLQWLLEDEDFDMPGVFDAFLHLLAPERRQQPTTTTTAAAAAAADEQAG